MSGIGSAIGDVVGSVFDTAGNLVEKAVDVIEETGDFVGDVVSEIDFEDALQAYIQTGGNQWAALWAATPGDEKIGYDYGKKESSGSYYEPHYTFEEGSDQPFQVNFAPGNEMPDLNIPGTTIGSPTDPTIYDRFGKMATDVVQKLQRQNQSPAIAQNVIGSMGGILGDIASGKFSKSPASEYNTVSVLKSYADGAKSNLSAGLLNDYATAKRKVAEMVETPSSPFGEVALQGNPFYNFMQQRDIGKRNLEANNIFSNFLQTMPQSQQVQSGLFEPYLQEQGIV